MGHGLELLTSEQMVAADRLAVAAGVSSLVLMENAGRAVADEAARMVPPGARVAVLAGPGNNGGDGFVAARLLADRGYEVRVACLVPARDLAGDAATMAARWTGPVEMPGPQALDDCHLIIDSLFGAGLSRPLEGSAAGIVRQVAAAHAPVLAVDVPSGVSGTTGVIVGDHAIRADRTVTFFRKKPGHVLYPGRALCGAVVLADIGIPSSVLSSFGPLACVNAPVLWRERWPSVGWDAHKYTRGHAVIVSGGVEMSGAGRLAARAALRAGAGLVTIAAPPEAMPAHSAQLNAIMLKECQTPEALRRLLSDRRRNALLIGPGLGLSDGALDRVMITLDSGAAVVLDADAITASAAGPADLFRAVQAKPERSVVLTPHEGEFLRLFPGAAGSKLERACQASALSGAVAVLKGADTVIAAPDGRAAINTNAPPTLATAGAGDVLAGFIAGLLAQGMPAFEAACAAVWLHGEAAGAFGPGLIAEDLPETLPAVLRKLLSSSRDG